MKNDRLILAALLAGGAWYLYTRSRGLTLTGAPDHVMLPSGVRPSQMSLVTPSASTSALATNVFSAIGSAFRSVLSSLQAAPGNTPRSPSPSFTIGQSDVSSWGLQVPRDEPPPPAAGAYDTQIPLWNWLPPTSAIPALPWTLNPLVLGFDPSYIPPPPGS